MLTPLYTSAPAWAHQGHTCEYISQAHGDPHWAPLLGYRLTHLGAHLWGRSRCTQHTPLTHSLLLEREASREEKKGRVTGS